MNELFSPWFNPDMLCTVQPSSCAIQYQLERSSHSSWKASSVLYVSFLWQHPDTVHSISLNLSILSPFFTSSCLWETGFIVGVCCPSARAKIDSKLQSLLRTPHCAAWPQNNTHRHTHTFAYKHEISSALPYFYISLSACWCDDRTENFRSVPADSSAPVKETLSLIHRC